VKKRCEGGGGGGEGGVMVGEQGAVGKLFGGKGRSGGTRGGRAGDR